MAVNVVPAPAAGTRARAYGLALAVLLAGETAAFATLLHNTSSTHHSLLLATLTTPMFCSAVWLLALLRLPARRAVALVLGGGAVLQVVALTQQPLTSDDDYRYIWDGTVQLAGVDPYRYAPQSPALDYLHNRLLFGTPGHCGHLIPAGCTAINRPAVHTVYPPVAQGLFDLVRIVSFGGHGGRLPFQIAAAIGALTIAGLLAHHCVLRSRPIWLVALWAWCPVTVSEFGNNAHIDWFAVLLTVLALAACARGRAGLAGLLLGAAVATKLYPIFVLPSLLRRRPGVVLAAAAALIAASYVPHVFAVGTKVVGFLPGYLHQEGYSSGSRLLLLDAALPASVGLALGVVIAGAVAYWAYRHSDPDVPEVTAVVVVGTAFLIATPNYGWYAALLIALVVMSGSWEWMPVAVAPTFTYLYRGEWLHTGIPSSAIYAMAAVLTGTAYLLRKRNAIAHPPGLAARETTRGRP
ncbi:MAG: glycosyltransferase 87 family protein [Actinomycetota bacterium]|nr:glycosyltransferase 87 family protein [Actinomycetota bacterium]